MRRKWPVATADLFQRGIGDAHARPAVDQQQLPFQRRQSRGMFGQNRVEQRPYAELLRAIAFQRHFRDAAFDHLKTNPAVPDVLRLERSRGSGESRPRDRGR